MSDPLIREVADAMVSSGVSSPTENRCSSALSDTVLATLPAQLVAAGYEYLNLDDGWAVGRTANGTIIPDPKLFPNGMAPLIAYVHSKGLKFGIYTARGRCERSVPPLSVQQLHRSSRPAAASLAWGGRGRTRTSSRTPTRMRSGEWII